MYSSLPNLNQQINEFTSSLITGKSLAHWQQKMHCGFSCFLFLSIIKHIHIKKELREKNEQLTSWPCRGDKFTQNLICLYSMGRHRQGSYSSINCLADYLLPHLTGTGWHCILWDPLDLGSLAQVRDSAALHRKGTSCHSVSLGQKCLLPSIPITG